MYFASVIIPVYNDSSDLIKVLDSLHNQSLPVDRYEVIVVDNGSTDNTMELAGRYGGVRFIQENFFLKSPYSCRNRGLEAAAGDIIILLDGTCIPEREWLEQGLTHLETSGADIVSSRVLFDFHGKVTAGKLYDSNNLSSEKAIIEKGVAKTASLFIRKRVFDVVGRFPEGVRSGADVRWTGKAARNGFRIEFCKASVAWKKARTFPESVKKQWRVGKGQPAIRRDQGIELNTFKLLVRSLIPPHPRRIKKLSENKGVGVNSLLLLRLYFVAWFIWVVMAIANIYGSYFTIDRSSATGSLSQTQPVLSEKQKLLNAPNSQAVHSQLAQQQKPAVQTVSAEPAEPQVPAVHAVRSVSANVRNPL